MTAPPLSPAARAAIAAELDRRAFAERLRVLDGAIADERRGLVLRRARYACSVDNIARNIARLEAERAHLLAERITR